MAELHRWRENKPPGFVPNEEGRLTAKAVGLLEHFAQIADRGNLDVGPGDRALDSTFEHELVCGTRRQPFGDTLLSAGALAGSFALLGMALLPGRPPPANGRALRHLNQAQPRSSISAPVECTSSGCTRAGCRHASELGRPLNRGAAGPQKPVWDRTGPSGPSPAARSGCRRRPTSSPAPMPRIGYAVRLDRGSVCLEVARRQANLEGPFSVETSQLEVTVVGTHFCVQALSGLSSVAVQHGRVRVQAVGARAASVVLEAGESIRSDSPRLVAPKPTARRERPAPSRRRHSPRGRRQPGMLENSLYRQALQATQGSHHPQAARLLGDYLERFPAGLYAPEVGAKLVTESWPWPAAPPTLWPQPSGG